MSLASEVFSSLPSFARRGAGGFLPSGPSFLPSVSKVFSAFPSTCPQLPPFSLWWRAVLLALALIYSVTSMAAEQYYAVGWIGSPNPQTAVVYLEFAKTLFPLDYRIRNAPAYIYAASAPKDFPVSLAIEKVNEAKKYNPFAADLHANLVKLYAQAKDVDNMQKEFAVLKRLAPMSPIVKNLEKAGLK